MTETGFLLASGCSIPGVGCHIFQVGGTSRGVLPLLTHVCAVMASVDRGPPEVSVSVCRGKASEDRTYLNPQCRLPPVTKEETKQTSSIQWQMDGRAFGI